MPYEEDMDIFFTAVKEMYGRMDYVISAGVMV